MRLETKVRLLGPVNHAPLREAVRQLDTDAWFEDTLRQDVFKKIHNQTRSIILVFLDVDVWPTVKVAKRAGWDRFSYLVAPILQSIIASHYRTKGAVIRAMLANLPAGGTIAPHTDNHASFAAAHRIHVPLVTNESVDFSIGGEVYNLKEGLAYEINNLDVHGVDNRSQDDRIHLIFDYLEL